MNKNPLASDPSPLGVGIVGFGASARIFHAPLIAGNPGFRLLGFFERTGKKGEAAWPGTTTWTSLEQMLACPDLDLVVICTPNTTHHALAMACLQAGKHVVVEKPFTVTVPEAEELAALASRNRCVLSVFHNRRWDGDFLTLSSVLDTRALGRIAEAGFAFERWAPAIRTKAWKEDGSEGNLLLDDLGSHLVDQALTLFGCPDEVLCWMDRQRQDTRVEDAFGVIMKCGDVRVKLSAGMLCRIQAPRFTVHGTRGSFVKYGLDPQEAQLGAGMTPQDPRYGLIDPESDGILDITGDSQPDAKSRIRTLKGDYPAFYQKLHECVTRGGSNPVSPDEAIMVMRVLEAARKSARTGSSVKP